MQDTIAMLSQMGYKRLYAPNQIVFFEGEIPKKLLVLIRGGVRIYKTHQNREETLHHIQAQASSLKCRVFLGLRIRQVLFALVNARFWRCLWRDSKNNVQKMFRFL